MAATASVFWTAAIGYTAWCAAYGPPYNDAYGSIIRAVWMMIAS